MDSFYDLCSDGTCCCLSQRSMVALIAVVSLVDLFKLATVLESLTSDSNTGCWYDDWRYQALEHVETLKTVFVTLFEMANILLLVAAIVESAVLVQLYVWYTLGFVVTALMISIAEFVCNFKQKGSTSFLEFIVEITFIFVVSRCLPLADTYRKHLNGEI